MDRKEKFQDLEELGLTQFVENLPKIGVCGVRSTPHTPIFGLSSRKCVTPKSIGHGVNALRENDDHLRLFF